MQQFARGSALSGFDSGVTQLAAPARMQAVASAQAAVNADNRTDVPRAQRLATHVAAVRALTDITVLDLQPLGVAVVDAAIQDMVTVLLPTKIPQHVKRHLRREARKPVDMGIRTYLMHIIRADRPKDKRFTCCGAQGFEAHEVLVHTPLAPKSYEGRWMGISSR